MKLISLVYLFLCSWTRVRRRSQDLPEGVVVFLVLALAGTFAGLSWGRETGNQVLFAAFDLDGESLVSSAWVWGSLIVQVVQTEAHDFQHQRQV